MATAKNGIIMEKKKFKDAMKRFIQTYKGDVLEVTEEVHKLWAQDIVKRTHPERLGIGHTAIENDLRAMLVVVKKPDNVDFYHELAEDPPGTNEHLFDVDGSRITDWYRSHRNTFGTKRSSRVKNFRDGGKIRLRGDFYYDMDRKLHVKPRDFKRLLTLKKKSVGKWKATFVKGMQRLGGRAPSWVTRHNVSSMASSRVKKDGSVTVQITGRVAFNPQRLEKIIAFTLRVRRRDLEGHFSKRLAAKVKAANRKAA